MLNQLPVWEKLAKQIIWKQIGTLNGKTILDFGSGTGITADHFAADNKVIAVEPSEEMLAKQVNTNGYQQIIGSIKELKKLPSESFDYIFCHNVLEYADDREIIVREFHRLLKPSGKLSIVKHNRNGRVMQMQCCSTTLMEIYGLRTFWDLQQNQDIQRNDEWQKKMIDIEMKVSQNFDFQKITFFHHLILEKRG